MLLGLGARDYRVYIGEEPCANLEVTSTTLECLPPSGKPRNSEDQSKLRMVVSFTF